MIDLLIKILSEFVINTISSMGYIGVGLLMAIESACIPLPSEIIMPFSGFLVAQGRFTLWAITLAGSIGSVLGSAVAYWVGKIGGRMFIEKYGKYILISHHDLDLADKFFQKYGNWAVFFSRMMPVVRTFISLPAGIARMNFTQFVIYTFAGSIPWCFALGYLGKKLGDHWEILGAYFHKFDLAIVILFILLVVWYIRRHINNIKKH